MADVVSINDSEDFTVLERIVLLNGVLPQQGDITTIRLVRRLREDLSFSEEEHAQLEIKNDKLPGGGERVTWDPSKQDFTKSIPLGPKMRGVIAASLKNLSKAGTLTERHIPLCDRFLFDAAEGAE